MCGDRIRLSLHMTDEDIVRRVAAMWGVAVCRLSPQKAHHKPTFRATIQGARALDWMLRLRPLLGERRKQQVDRAEAAWSAPSRRRSLLHPHDLRAIIAAVEAGQEKVPEIAERYGIQRESVYRIVRRAREGTSRLMRQMAS